MDTQTETAPVLSPQAQLGERAMQTLEVFLKFLKVDYLVVGEYSDYERGLKRFANKIEVVLLWDDNIKKEGVPQNVSAYLRSVKFTGKNLFYHIDPERLEYLDSESGNRVRIKLVSRFAAPPKVQQSISHERLVKSSKGSWYLVPEMITFLDTIHHLASLDPKNIEEIKGTAKAADIMIRKMRLSPLTAKDSDWTAANLLTSQDIEVARFAAQKQYIDGQDIFGVAPLAKFYDARTKDPRMAILPIEGRMVDGSRFRPRPPRLDRY